MPPAWANLLGGTPGTTGPALRGLQLGAPVATDSLPDLPSTSWTMTGDESRRLRFAPDDSAPRVNISLEIHAGRLTGIRAELYTARGSIPEDSCAAFVSALEARYGASPERIWIDRANHVRMAFLDTCRLRFERYVDVATWIGPEPTSVVPVSLVGKSTKELASRVGPDSSLEGGITLRVEGVGEQASGPTRIDVYVEKDVITALGVDAPASAADRAAIRDRISSAFDAKPRRDPTTGYDVWATKPPIRMVDTSGGIRVEVGKL